MMLIKSILLLLFPLSVTFSIPPARDSVRPSRRPQGRRRQDGSSPHDQIYCHNETDPPTFTAGDPDDGGPGIMLTNYDNSTHDTLPGALYFFYESSHDHVPWKYILLPPFVSAFVALCPTFEGRVVRGDRSYLDGQKHLLGTWVEVEWFNGSSYGDVSLLQGNDGAAIIQSLDGFDKAKGFTLDLVTNAPSAALAQKQSGSWCLDMLVGPDGGNSIAKDWEAQFLSPWDVYLENDKDPVIDSNNGRFVVTFYQGIV